MLNFLRRYSRERPKRALAEDYRCAKDHEPVDEPARKKRCCQPGSAFNQERDNSSRLELVKRIAHVDRGELLDAGTSEIG